MSEDKTNPPADKEAPDAIKQIKSEFQRKHKETSDILSQIQQTQAALQATIEKSIQSAQPKQVDTDDSDLMYSDPKAWRQKIKNEAKQEALNEMRSETYSQASVNQAIAQLAAEYPELSDNESDLTKKTVEILKGVSDAEKTNPRTYEYAVMKAAQGMDVKPRSKRPVAEEDFVAPSYSSPQGRRSKRSSEQVVSQNKDIASSFGLNLDDPKMKERYLNLLKQKGIS